MSNPTFKTASTNSLKKSLEGTVLSIENLVRERGKGQPVTMSEVKTLDTMLTETQATIASALYRGLGKLVVNSGYKIHKNAMVHETQLPNGKTRDTGIQKRAGFIQSHLLKLKDGCHHLRNAGYVARLLPCGQKIKVSEQLSRGVNQKFDCINGQAKMANPQNVADFFFSLVDYFDANPKITGETKIDLYEIGLRNYDKIGTGISGTNGVKVTSITYNVWRERALKEAEKRQKMALNAVQAKEVAEAKRTEREEKKIKAQSKSELLAKHLARLVEMAENASISDIIVRNEVKKTADLLKAS
jgi:hypothetical protein